MRPHPLAAWSAALFLSACLFSHTVALRLLLLLLAAALCGWIAWRERGGALSAIPPIWIAFAAWALWSALSIAWSQDPARSEKEFRNEILYTGLALWTCYVAGQSEKSRRAVPIALSIAAVTACASAIYSFPKGVDAYSVGIHGGAGNHSSILLMLMPCAVAGGWYAWRAALPRWIVAAAALLVLLFLVSAYTTLNRTVWIGFVAEAFLFAFLLRPGDLGSRRRLLLGLAGVLVLVVSAAILWRIQVERETEGGAPPLTRDPRFAIWREAADAIEERPFTGYGFGRGILRRSLTQETGDNLAWHSHNLFLDMTLQTGLPGAVLLVVLLLATAWQGWKLARGPTSFSQACGAALLAVVLGMAIRNLTDVLWVRHISLLYWGLVGTLLAWGRERAA